MLITGDFGSILYLQLEQTFAPFQPGAPGVPTSCASRKFKEASGGCGSLVDVSCGGLLIYTSCDIKMNPTHL